MKRFLGVGLAFMTVLSIAGCSGKTENAAPQIEPIGGVVRLERPSVLPEFEEELPSSMEELQFQQVSVSQQETAPIQQQIDTPTQQIQQAEVPVEIPAQQIEQKPVEQPIVETPVAEPEKMVQQPNEVEETSRPVQNTANRSGEVKAVWISYLDFQTLLQGKSQSQFTSNISNAFDKIQDTGLNTVIVQVRPFGDALYESEYFPWSYIVTGTEGKNPGFDPLKIMVREAHNRGLSIEAWINPYRIRVGGYTKAISNDNIAMEWYEKGSDAVIKYGGGYYYNPGSKDAQNLIVKGVREIVENYKVDGIHFDDYFYPTTDASFDQATYQNSGTSLSLADWRRENVNKLVKATYSAVKDVDSSVRFGISPQGNFSNNYNVQYSDVELWMANSGYVDYICPQIYWGFKHATAPYKTLVAQWDSKVRAKDVDLYIGLAFYKLGTTEASYAGEGLNEWKNTSDLMARMVETGRTADNYGGFMLFRYDSLYNPSSSVSGQVKKELANLKDIL